MVGAESVVCPRCGVNFRTALIRMIVLRTLSVLVFIWLVSHFVFKKL
jgi:hypothetical protein